MADNRIAGRLALVTGASGGIGSACARDLAAQGAHLALTYRKNKTSIDALVAELNSKMPSVRVSVHQVDLESQQEIEELLKDVKAEHKANIEILVSNAGYSKRLPDISDISIDLFDYTLSINLRASFLLVKTVVEDMKVQKWGRIIFISSIAAIGAGINGPHYAASKGGLSGMMKNLATRLAKYNISVNDVAPAMIGDTGMIPNSASIPGVMEGIPLGRLGMPEEVANVVTMFARTGYATGQSFLLAGGLR